MLAAWAGLCLHARTQGCCMRIIEYRCRRVFIGAMEPANFQICEGVRIMQEAGIDVVRLSARTYLRVLYVYTIFDGLSDQTSGAARATALTVRCLACPLCEHSGAGGRMPGTHSIQLHFGDEVRPCETKGSICARGHIRPPTTP